MTGFEQNGREKAHSRILKENSLCAYGGANYMRFTVIERSSLVLPPSMTWHGIR